MNEPTRPIVVWFRRDLRVRDNPALFHAAKTGLPLLPLFILDDPLIDRLPSDGAVFDFQRECLASLRGGLESLGGALMVRRGSALDVHRSIIETVQPRALYYNRDYEPDGRKRDIRVGTLYKRNGIEVSSFPDVVIHEPEELLTRLGTPYVVFTPFAHAWKRLSHPSPLPLPPRFVSPSFRSESIAGAKELHRSVTITTPAFKGGSEEAERTWRDFVKERIESYEQGRDDPAGGRTSRMSPYLRFGAVSPRVLLDECSSAYRTADASGRDSILKFVEELIWREFYAAVLYHLPRVSRESYRKGLDEYPWRRSEKDLNAWKEGRTGYPLVDAGMRELNTTGWMHNRVRMVVASFLTKDLGIHWREGERYFAEKLFDIETASNNGGWQWSASTGVDPKPLRIFNPTVQAERFDPDGVYIRRFVPELSRVPRRFIHEPWKMSPILQKELGVVISRDYPAPIVDHGEASKSFKDLYARIVRQQSARR